MASQVGRCRGVSTDLEVQVVTFGRTVHIERVGWEMEQGGGERLNPNMQDKFKDVGWREAQP